MIASLIQTALQLATTLIGLFVKDAKKGNALKEQMFQLVEDHAANVSKNVAMRREYEILKQQINNPEKPDKPVTSV